MNLKNECWKIWVLVPTVLYPNVCLYVCLKTMVLLLFPSRKWKSVRSVVLVLLHEDERTPVQNPQPLTSCQSRKPRKLQDASNHASHLRFITQPQPEERNASTWISLQSHFSPDDTRNTIFKYRRPKATCLQLSESLRCLLPVCDKSLKWVSITHFISTKCLLFPLYLLWDNG